MTAPRFVFVSPKGGVGRTTLVAHVAARLTAGGRRSLAVDLDPQNALGFHLVNPSSWLQTNETRGVLDPGFDANAVLQLLRVHRARAALVPFGVASNHAALAKTQSVLTDPDQLALRLGSLAPPRCSTILIDTPGGRNPWSQAALTLADEVVVLLTADPACLASLPSFERYIAEVAPQLYPHGIRYLVNQWNPGSQLACDTFLLLEETLQGHLIERPIHYDACVQESMARCEPLRLVGSAQVNDDLDSLAELLWELSSSRAELQARESRTHTSIQLQPSAADNHSTVTDESTSWPTRSTA